jgi:hypothetical protein
MAAKGRPEATALYDQRAVAISSLALDGLSEYISQLPRAPFDEALDTESTVRFLLCIYIIGSVRSAQEVCSAFQLSWFAGQFLAASMLIRMLVELWGAVLFAESKVLPKIESGEPLVANERVVKLLFGSKSGVRGPSGELLVEPPVNVLEFVRATDAARPGTLGDYSFLCDAAHPSYLQNTYLLFAGSQLDNWRNEVFAREMHETLDRTLTIGTVALDGLTAAATRIFGRCVPLIRKAAGL